MQVQRNGGIYYSSTVPVTYAGTRAALVVSRINGLPIYHRETSGRQRYTFGYIVVRSLKGESSGRQRREDDASND
jgi:hypothetical protein